MIATAAIVARFLLCPDFKFQPRGSVSHIDWALDYIEYRRILLENKESDVIKDLISYFQREIFGPDNVTEPTTSAAPATISMRQFDAFFRSIRASITESPVGSPSGHNTSGHFEAIKPAVSKTKEGSESLKEASGAESEDLDADEAEDKDLGESPLTTKSTRVQHEREETEVDAFKENDSRLTSRKRPAQATRAPLVTASQPVDEEPNSSATFNAILKTIVADNVSLARFVSSLSEEQKQYAATLVPSKFSLALNTSAPSSYGILRPATVSAAPLPMHPMAARRNGSTAPGPSVAKPPARRSKRIRNEEDGPFVQEEPGLKKIKKIKNSFGKESTEDASFRLTRARAVTNEKGKTRMG